MGAGLVTTWIGHQFVDQLWLDHHVATTATFFKDEANRLMHVVEDAFIIKTLDGFGETVHQI
jgi:hypothetical protein